MRFGSTIVIALVALVGVVSLGSGPASAHDDVGAIEIVSTEETPSTTEPGAVELSVEARLTFENDGHPADANATMTFVAEAADGTAVGPIVAEPAEAPGTFAATLLLPSGGAWTLRASALQPFASLDVPLDLAAQPEGAPSTSPWIPIVIGSAVITAAAAAIVVVLTRRRRRAP